MTTAKKYELTFWGGISKRYRRWHDSQESAEECARAILAKMDSRAAHPAIIYGPGCGKDGITVA